MEWNRMWTRENAHIRFESIRAENLKPWAAIKISTHQAPRALAREGTHKKSCIFQQISMQIQVSKASQGLMGCDFLSDPEKTWWIETGCEREKTLTSGLNPSGFFWAAKKITTHQALWRIWNLNLHWILLKNAWFFVCNLPDGLKF